MSRKAANVYCLWYKVQTEFQPTVFLARKCVASKLFGPNLAKPCSVADVILIVVNLRNSLYGPDGIPVCFYEVIARFPVFISLENIENP